MTQLQYSELVDHAHAAGFTGIQAQIIAAIAMAESGGNSLNYLVNTDGTVDRGILQINSYWHAEVPDSCAYDVACSFQQAYRISNHGTDFNQWVTYQKGLYKKFMDGTPTGNPSLVGSGFATTSLTDPLAPLKQVVKNVTDSPAWSWLVDPVRVIKMVVGVLVVLLALILLFAPDSNVGKVVQDIGKGKLPSTINPVD